METTNIKIKDRVYPCIILERKMDKVKLDVFYHDLGNHADRKCTTWFEHFK